jgi:hypothetical protein
MQPRNLPLVPIPRYGDWNQYGREQLEETHRLGGNPWLKKKEEDYKLSMKWKTQAGDVIDIKDMEKRHLQNSIEWLRRQVNANEVAMACVDVEDIGAFTLWQTREQTDSMCNVIKKMEAELKSRNHNNV